MKVLLTSGEVPLPGGEAFLPKPYKYEELLRRVRTLLELDR